MADTKDDQQSAQCPTCTITTPTEAFRTNFGEEWARYFDLIAHLGLGLVAARGLAQTNKGPAPCQYGLTFFFDDEEFRNEIYQAAASLLEDINRLALKTKVGDKIPEELIDAAFEVGKAFMNHIASEGCPCPDCVEGRAQKRKASEN